MLYILTIDGSSDNDGCAGWGVVSYNGCKQVFSGSIRTTRSTVAEFYAALKALEVTPDGADVILRTDCDAVCKAFTCGIPAHKRLCELLNMHVDRFKSFECDWISRDTNVEAHNLANAGRLLRREKYGR